VRSRDLIRQFQYLYGPVPSRRLGRSLGVDLVPPRSAPTIVSIARLVRQRRGTLERKEYIPPRKCWIEVKDFLSKGGVSIDHFFSPLRRANPSLQDRFSHQGYKEDVRHPCCHSNQWIVALFRRGEGRFVSDRYHPPLFRCRVQRGFLPNHRPHKGF